MQAKHVKSLSSHFFHNYSDFLFLYCNPVVNILALSGSALFLIHTSSKNVTSITLPCNVTRNLFLQQLLTLSSKNTGNQNTNRSAGYNNACSKQLSSVFGQSLTRLPKTRLSHNLCPTVKNAFCWVISNLHHTSADAPVGLEDLK